MPQRVWYNLRDFATLDQGYNARRNHGQLIII